MKASVAILETLGYLVLWGWDSAARGNENLLPRKVGKH